MKHLQDYTDRVYIIDNKKEEITPLEDCMKELDIDVTVFNTNENKTPSQLKKNRQLLFVDLMLDENEDNAKSNISRLVVLLCKLIPENFGPYGLVAWTKHKEYLELLMDDIKTALGKEVNIGNTQEEDLVTKQIPVLLTAPTFIVPVDKTKYLEKNSYKGLLADIENTLKSSLSGYFFMTWNASVKNAIAETINKIFELSDNFLKRDDQIEYLLHALAKNHTGTTSDDYVNMSVDCYKSFDEILFGNLYIKQKGENDLQFRKGLEKQWDDSVKDLVEAKLNTLLFIDTNAISQDIIVPGNVYKLKGDALMNALSDEDKKYNNEYYILDIAIELTPPCDFSHKKVMSRIIHGFLLEKPDKIAANQWKKIVADLNKAGYRYVLNNIVIKDKIQILVFDYRYLYTPKDEDLKDNTKYEIFFRVKPKLFADILPKFASHADRIGLSSIHL